MMNSLVRAAFRFVPEHYGVWSVTQRLPWRPDPHRIVTRPLRGYPLQIRFKPGSYVGAHLFYRGIYEFHNVQMCSTLLRQGMAFIDVGANYGLYSLVAARAVGETGRVLAVEPQAELAQLIRESIAINHLQNVVVQPCALSDAPGDALLYQPSRSNGSSTLRLQEGENCYAEALPVKCQTLPDVLTGSGIRLDRGAAIKIDVEGAELLILEKASDVIRSSVVEFILCESIDSHLQRFGGSSKQLLSFLWDHDFATACLRRGNWHHMRTFEEYEMFGCVPDVLAVRPGTPSWNRVAATIFKDY